MTLSIRSLVLAAALTGCAYGPGGDSAPPADTDTTDTEVPVGDTEPCYYDGDVDGAGGEPAGLFVTCPTGTVTNGLDCNDNDPAQISCDDAYVEPVADPVWVQQVRQDGLVLLADGLACVDESHLNRPDLELGVFGYNLAGAQSASDWRRAAYTFYDHSTVADVRCVRLPVDRPLRLALAAIDEDGAPVVWLNPTDRFSGYSELYIFTFLECNFLYGSTELVQKVNLCLQYTDSISAWSSPDGSCEALYVGPPECEDVDDDHDDDVDPPAGDTVQCYTDLDNDNYGEGSLREYAGTACGHQLASVAGDCNDNDASVHPGRLEAIGDGVDNDCDGVIDAGGGGGQQTWYRDVDGDGYGGTTTTTAVGQPVGYVSRSGDCDDTDSDNNPGQPEVGGDGEDNDCDGAIDEVVGGGGGGGGAVSMEIRANGYGAASTLWGRYLVGQAGQQGNLPTWTSARGGVGAVTRLYIDTTVNGVRDAGATEFVFASSGGYDLTHTGTYTLGQQVEICARDAISDYRWGILRLGGSSDNWVTQVGDQATVNSPVLTGSSGQDRCATWTID